MLPLFINDFSTFPFSAPTVSNDDNNSASGSSSKSTRNTTPIASSSSKAGSSTGVQRRIIATPSQLRYIKSLLGASSRLGRALAELFGLLVKLCVGNRIRLRHPQNVSTSYMSSASRDIARVLSYILVDGLSYDQLPPSPIPKLKQTFLICSIGFTSPMLFDEKRFAYHLMLHKFCEEGGLHAFFEMFGFALSLESDSVNAVGTNSAGSSNNQNNKSDEKSVSVPSSILDATTTLTINNKALPSTTDDTTKTTTATTAPNKSTQQSTTSANNAFENLIIPQESFLNNEEHSEFPSGSGEFLDAWLMLLEKMVNPKAILESPHVITMKSLRNKPEFDNVSYLINVHILAFETVTKIWSFKPIRTYGPRMTESMLTIMKHIYQGEPILREKYNKKLTEQSSTSTTEKTTLKFGSGFPRAVNPFESDATTRITRLSSTTSANSTVNANTPVNEAHLNQLMDMGFLAEHCREALYHTGSVEQATEYLLAHTAGSSSLNSSSNTNTNLHATNMGIDSDDDENIDAEMMVLMGTKLPTENASKSTTNDADESNKAESSSATFSKRNRRGMRNTITVLPNHPPLSEQLLSDFGEEAVRTSLYLIDQVSDAVFKGTELLGILFRRTEIKYKMLATIIGTMINCAEQLHAMLCDRTTPIETIFFGEIGCRFAVRLHVFCLFLDVPQYHDLRTPTVLSMKEFKLMPKLISLLNQTEDVLTSKAGKCLYTPKWLSQMILLIDLYEKVVISTRRRNEMHRITTNTWKWYDVASGKWNAYSAPNNKTINDAYWAGEPTVRVSVGRHRYTINFNCMSQVNEETGNHRPVVLGLLSSVISTRVQERVSATLSYIFGSDNEENSNVNAENDKTNEAKSTASKKSTAINTPTTPHPTTVPTANPANKPQTDSDLDRTTVAALCEMRENHLRNGFRTYYTMSVANNSKKSENPQPTVTPDDVKLLGLEEFSTENIVATCVRLMSPKICVDRDSLHALMMLCVRLTTKYKNAEVFAQEGGIKLLLEMKQTGGYIRASTLANLLIRHTLEEPRTLAMAMEKVIAARTLQTIPPGYRDLIFMLRRMSSAVARDPDTFKQIARSMLRIDINALRRGVFSEDYRLIMKSIAPPNSKRSEEKPNENSIPVKVIYDLLQALIVPVNSSQKQTFEEKLTTSASKSHNRHANSSSAFTSASSLHQSTSNFGNNNNNNNGNNHANDIIEETFRHTRPLVDDNDLSFIAMSIGCGNSDNQRNSIEVGSSRINSISNRDLLMCDNNLNSSSNNDSSSKQYQSLLNDSWNVSNSKNENDKPLLPKSTILKALAEAVRSYQSVGVIIAEYTYQPQPNTLIRKAQPALAFILDNLLPSTEQNPDRECSSGARMLIAALSAATDSQITHTVVTEVQSAILRALSWPEIPEKHQQLQLLTALIPTMIENCPPDNPAMMRFQQHQPRRNDIFNIMVRKGLIADLANITQSLDLSSPNTILTIGTALKSLEQLLRMSNQPVSLQFNKNRSNDGENNSNNAEDAQMNEIQAEDINLAYDENTANDEHANEMNEDDTIDNDPNATSETQNTAATETDEIEATPDTGTDTPTNTNNTNEPETQDASELGDIVNFIEHPRVVDVQPIDSTMLEEIRRRLLDRDPLIDETATTRSSISSGAATRGKQMRYLLL